MALGEILANLRKSKGLSQEQLAAELDLTRQTISKWELNQSTPDINYLAQLSDFFGVSTDYLIKGEQANHIPHSDSAGSESDDAVHIETRPGDVFACKWCILFGTVIMGASLIGIIAFVICSALHPWTAIVNNMAYEGLLGFLIGTKTLWFFILLSALLIAGFSVSAYGIIKSKKRK